MQIKVLKNSEELGKEAAKYSAEILNKAIKKKRKSASYSLNRGVAV